MQKIAFLDRDGVIIYDHGYMHDTEKITILPNVIEGLHELKKLGYLFIIISNQAGVGRNYFTKEAAEQFHSKVLQCLSDNNIEIGHSYFCYHIPTDNCECRKPNIGMFEQAAADFSVDIEKSIMVGDKDADTTFGNSANLKTFRIKGNQYPTTVQATHEVVDLLEVAQILL